MKDIIGFNRDHNFLSNYFPSTIVKFRQSPTHARKLQATGDALLVEQNTWHDNYWSDCVCDRCGHEEGEKRLGKILMKIREDMINAP